MYLLYDVIQRRRSALGNSLLVKRSDYDAVQEVLSSLTYERLVTAAQSLSSEQKTSDPAIASLRQAIEIVASKVPNSFTEKQEMRLHLRGLFIEYGLAAFWLTINPSDLRDPLVLKLAGVTIPQDGLKRTNAALRRKIATMNPAAIAVFFNKVCTGVLEALISPGEGRVGIFGEVSTYFGVVETNGRGMLHLHCLVWLAGNLDFFNLRGKMLNDPDFASEMVDFLDSIISEHIDPIENEASPVEASLPLTGDFEGDDEYANALHSYANVVASKRQMHSKNHNSTCYKYNKKGTRQCRFFFPRPKVEASHIDKLGIAHLRRDNEWINPFNPCIAAAIGSNQDLSFLATRAKALALLYYITNYATKDEASTYQMVMTAAVMRKTLEQAEQATHPSDAEKIAIEKGKQKFALRVFNRMAHDKEVSGVQVASSLLQLPAYYTPSSELHRINLYYLRRRLPALIQHSDDEESRNEEVVTLRLNHHFRVSSFDNYRWRGSELKDLCLYEYIKIIKKEKSDPTTRKGLRFHKDHPEYGKMTQIICNPESDPRTVALLGPLSQYQQDEDRIRGGHPETLAMQNDLAGILLALFVPWEILPSLFHDVKDICGDECDANCDKLSHTGLQVCSIVWAKIKNSLPKHVQEFARNVELLRKTKDDVDIDMIERKAAASAMQNAFNPDLDDADEMVAGSTVLNGSVDNDTLRLSYHLIKQRWTREDQIMTAKISLLQQRWQEPAALSLESFTSIPVDSEFGIRSDISAETLSLWSSLIGNTKTSKSTNNTQADTDVLLNINSVDTNDNDEDQSDADDEYSALEPALAFVPSIMESMVTEHMSARLDQYHSPVDITNVITEVMPLNTQQKRTISMVFHHVMQHQGRYMVEDDNQFLLYVAGEGGTGKSWVIEAIRVGMKLLQRDQEVLVIAPTGNAAKHVQGSTVHTGLNVPVKGNRKKITEELQSLWKKKTMLIIDEISMVGSVLMNSIDKQCAAMRNLSSDSTTVFGGLPVVIVLGDFHQFPPVRKKSLWQAQDTDEEKRGQQLWHMFKHVIILDEQMRQQQDPQYYQLLRRARNGSITQGDVDVLNTRVVSQLNSLPEEMTTCIVRKNKLRHTINRIQIERFARSQGQKIFVFPARHTRRKKRKGQKVRDLTIDELLELQDGSEAKGPGLLFYTKNMPTVVLMNISTPLGIVNGAQGTSVGVVPDPNGLFHYYSCQKQY
jgi:PIF1-like helicase/Helitron helicase-like domain at N-terminus